MILAPLDPVMVRAIVRARDIDGLSFAEIGRRYQVSAPSILRTYRRWREWARLGPGVETKVVVEKMQSALATAERLLDCELMLNLSRRGHAERIQCIEKVLLQIKDARKLARANLGETP